MDNRYPGPGVHDCAAQLPHRHGRHDQDLAGRRLCTYRANGFDGKVLRRWASNANAYCNSNSYSHAHSYANCDSNGTCNGNAYSYSYCNGNGNSNTFRDTELHANQH